MTQQELSQFIYLKKEIETEKKRLQTFEDAEQSKTNILPIIPQVSSQSLRLKIIEQMLDCKRVIEERVAQSVQEYKKISEYVSQIEDAMIRQTIIYRFMQGMSWVQIALELGGGNRPDGVRMMVKRYLAKQR